MAKDPRWIGALAEQTRKLYESALVGDESVDAEDDSFVSLEAEQFFLLAFEALKQAEHYFELAELNQTRALAEARMG